MAIFKGYSTVDVRFGNVVLEDIALAKRDLLNHFYTRKGERLGQPEFGSILPDLVFEPLDDLVIDLVEDDVRDIIDNDPRWILNNLDVQVGTHSITCVVNLTYRDTATVDELYLEFTAETEEENL
jgi:phage baseplate assembly protein W